MPGWGPRPRCPSTATACGYRSSWTTPTGIITDYGNHRFDSVHQIMGDGDPAHRGFLGGAVQQEERAGDIYDMQVATFEYPNFILNYEACNYNGHGLGGRTPGMRYYGAMGTGGPPARHGILRDGGRVVRGPHRNGALSRAASCPRARRAAEGGAQFRSGNRGWKRCKVNEDEPTPLHTKNFVDSVRARKEPFANIDVGIAGHHHWLHRERGATGPDES